MPDNHIATAEDFKRAAASANPPERVVLPKSGLAVLLRRPTTFAVWMLDQKLSELQLPEAGSVLPEKESTGNPSADGQLAADNYSQWRDTVRRTVEEAFVQPKLSLIPGPNEISPNWLPEEDQVFVLRWVRGLIAPDGTDLVEKFFRAGKGGAQPDSGAGGEGVGLPAQPDPEPDRKFGTED